MYPEEIVQLPCNRPFLLQNLTFWKFHIIYCFEPCQIACDEGHLAFNFYSSSVVDWVLLNIITQLLNVLLYLTFFLFSTGSGQLGTKETWLVNYLRLPTCISLNPMLCITPLSAWGYGACIKYSTLGIMQICLSMLAKWQLVCFCEFDAQISDIALNTLLIIISQYFSSTFDALFGIMWWWMMNQ